MIYEERISGDWAEAFARQGLLVVRGFYDEHNCIQTLDSFHRVFHEKGIDPGESHDLIGIHQQAPDLWSLIVDKRLIALLRQLVNGDVHYAEESKIGTGSLVHGWHRDDGHVRTTPLTQEQLDAEGYVRLRVIRYLREKCDPNNVVHFRPGTHCGSSDYGELQLEVRPADLVVFNSLVVHRGANPRDNGRKYISTMTYGNNVSIAKEVFRHNARARRHEGYYCMSDELLERLETNGIAPLSLDEKHALDRELCIL